MPTYGDLLQLFLATRQKGIEAGAAAPQAGLQLGASARDAAAQNASDAVAAVAARTALGSEAPQDDLQAVAALRVRQAEQKMGLETRASEAGIEKTRAEAEKARQFMDPAELARIKAGLGMDKLNDEQAARMVELEKKIASQEGIAGRRIEAGHAGDPMKLRKEFNTQIKTYVGQRDNYNRLVAASSDVSGANDIALIFNYMKMLDPNSVVREGEFATAETAGRSVPNMIWALYNRAVKGERLTPDQRAQIVASGRSQYEGGAKPAIDRLIKFYEQRAVDSGINPDSIVGGFGSSTDSGVPSAGAGSTPAAPAAPTGRRIKVDAQGNPIG